MKIKEIIIKVILGHIKSYHPLKNKQQVLIAINGCNCILLSRHTLYPLNTFSRYIIYTTIHCLGIKFVQRHTCYLPSTYIFICIYITILCDLIEYGDVVVGSQTSFLCFFFM